MPFGSLAPTNKRLCAYLRDLTNDKSLLIQGCNYWSHMTVRGWTTYNAIYETIHSSAGNVDGKAWLPA